MTRPGHGCIVRVLEPRAFPSTRRVRAARRFVRGRAVRRSPLIDTHGRLRGLRPPPAYVTASVVKAMLLVGRLRQLGGHLPSSSTAPLLDPMIRVSDNRSADAAYRWVGDAGLVAIGKAAGMHDLVVPGRHWGNVQFSAADQARLFLRIDRLVPTARAPTRCGLLSSIVSYQRWGFSRFSLRRGWHTVLQGRLAPDRARLRSSTRPRCSSAAAAGSRWRC